MHIMKQDSEYKQASIHEEWRPAVVLVWKDRRGLAKRKSPSQEADPQSEDEIYIQDEF